MGKVHKLRFKVQPVEAAEHDLVITPRAVFNAAYAGRDAEDVERHIADVVLGGERPRFPIPSLAPVSVHNLVTLDEVQEYTPSMIGEVEYVLVFHRGQLFVGVGSDHCDWLLEKHDFAHSKNVAPDVMANRLWRWSDVRDHFDELLLRCRVRVDGAWRVTQEATCSTLRSPNFWLDHAAFSGGIADGTMLFSGTINHIAGLLKGDAYEVSMTDPRLGRVISHTYQCMPATVPKLLDVRGA
ncbi:DUF2848 family protein [Mesorhizobium sp. KR9-304]|uniref:DUF2848 family protein n=1 Tax=Mesorhizobium sp. KR9-304 TaxID=3156614 RepID=UPI0032B4E43E